MFERFLISLVKLYQLALSSWRPASCRFHPTCSAYAIEAIQEHGVVRGPWLAFRRIISCHPWGRVGYNPVPRRDSLTADTGVREVPETGSESVIAQ